MTAHGPQFPTHNDPVTGALHIAYCPGRDFINLYPLMLHQVAQHFERGRYDEEIQKLANASNCSFDEAKELVVDVMAAQTEFVRISCENPEETFLDVMSRVGWYKINVHARQLLLAAMGELVQGQVFAGIRDVARAGESPPRHWQLVLTQYWDTSRYLLAPATEQTLAVKMIVDGVRRLLALQPRSCYAALTEALQQDSGKKLSLFRLLKAVCWGWFNRHDV